VSAWLSPDLTVTVDVAVAGGEIGRGRVAVGDGVGLAEAGSVVVLKVIEKVPVESRVAVCWTPLRVAVTVPVAGREPAASVPPRVTEAVP